MEEVVTRDGLRYVVDPSDGRAQALIASQGEFNATSVRIFQSLLKRRRWELILDIGSNYGEMIAAIPKDFAGRVLAFEPDPRLRPFLQRTADINDVDIEIRPQAIGRADSHARFVIDSQWTGCSSLVGANTASSTDVIDVEVLTLDSLLRGETGTALVKIDVEGAERDVLAGGAEFLAGLDDCAIQIEILHMTPEEIARIASRWKLYFLSRTTLKPVRLPGDDTLLATLYVNSHRFYQNDAVLLPLDNGVPLAI